MRIDCGGEFEKNNIFMLECFMIYLEEEDFKNKGLCYLIVFLVVWFVKRVELGMYVL